MIIINNTYEVVIRNSNNCYTCFYIVLVAFPLQILVDDMGMQTIYIDHADYSCRKRVMFSRLDQ